MFLVLCALILRPVAFKFRSKVANPIWRSIWDWALFGGGLVPALVFGVAFGNVIEGVPFRFDDTLRMTYEGTLFGLLNPFALLCGLVSVSMLVMHGGAYLALKADEPVASRAATCAQVSALVMLVLFAAAGIWVSIGIRAYSIVGHVVQDGPSNPLLKEVARGGTWLDHYFAQPWIVAAPLLVLAGALATIVLLGARRNVLALIVSGFSIAGVIATAGLSVFPFLLPSSLDAKSSLTVWDASSSRLTLTIMLGATILFLPIILAYTAWVYHVLRGRVTLAYVINNSSSTY
jgi:cytochrome d ubiquinol oxidase subunit II